MELNAIRQDIAVNKSVFDGNVEQPIDTEILLPDYCNDIKRILKCFTEPQIYSKKISGDSLSIDGTCCITVIYADEDNNICSCTHDHPFNKSINVGDGTECQNICVTAEPDYVNCRAITPRKIDFHGTVALKIKLSRCINNEIITDIDLDGIQLKRESCPATNPLANSEKMVVFEEELELDKSDRLIKCIFRKCIYTVIDECKILGSKAVIKGDLIAKILYTDENDRFDTFEGKIPFNQIVDIEADGDNCRCDAKINVMSYEIKPRTNISGEARSFSLDCKMLISVTASCDNDIPAITDAFNIKRPMKFTLSDISFKKLVSNVNEKYLCSKSLDFSENTFGTIVDMWSQAKVNDSKILDGELIIDGTVTVCFLLKDADGEPQYFERGIDFRYKHPVESSCGELAAECNVVADSVSYTITGSDKIDIRVELCIDCAVYGICKRNVLTDVSVDEDATPVTRKAPIIVYYCSKGESAWEIAKKYNCDYNSILKMNELEGDYIEQNRMMLIS